MKKNAYSLILYRDKGAPQYFQIPSPYVKGFFIGLPIIAIIALAASFGGAVYFKQIRSFIEKKEPLIIKELRIQNEELQTKLNDQEELVASLTKKMANPTVENLHLNLFAPPLGMQDKTSTPTLSIEETSVTKGDKQIEIGFNIVNMASDSKRLSGHFFVVLKINGHFFIYPEENLIDSEHILKYNQGESFATSRFRPVRVSFKNLPSVIENYLVKIIIFSRSGDLLFSKILTPES